MVVVTDVSMSQSIMHVGVSPSVQVEEQIAALTAVLRSWAYEVQVLAPLSRQFRQRLQASGVQAQELVPSTSTSLVAYWSEARRLAARIRELRPALVHAWGFRAGLAAIMAREALPEAPPVALSPHLVPHLLSDAPGAHLRRRAYRWILRRCDAIIVESETQRAQLSLLDREAAQRAELVPYGLTAASPADSLDLGRKRQLLGMTQAAAIVGCVVDGLPLPLLELFLDAAGELCSRYPSLEFALIGRDVDRPHYHDLAHRRGLLGASAFVDPHDRMIRAISALNVLVTLQPGWPSGMLALQALAQDVGVVALEGGEVAEMLRGATGVTVAAANGATAIGEGIIEQLMAAAERMPMTAESLNAPALSPFLVSREFYDLGQSWAVPDRRQDASEQEQHSTRQAVAAFPAHRAARALVAVYHRLLDEAISPGE